MPSTHQPSAMRRIRALAVVLLGMLAAERMEAQQTVATAPQPRVPTGWEITGVPALNYDADEGFGYGAIVELYDYGRGLQPYRMTIQPTLFLTTEGRRDLTLFMDAPSLLPGGWRMSAFVGREQQLAQPYYGIGNETVNDESASEGANPYFYRFGRTRTRATADFQHRIGSSAARLLLGGGFSRSVLDLTPFDSGTTLLAAQLQGVAPRPNRDHYVRAGLVWDTRDREIGAHRGTWAELLVQRVAKPLGASEDYTRWTVTARQYVPVASRLTFAQRVVAQGVDGDAPVSELATLQSSFKQQEGLGGSSTIRGLPRNRFVGKALFLSNSELRWRVGETTRANKTVSLTLNAFFDAGRVWDDRFDVATALSDLHAGYGAGARLGVGNSFVVALDVGHSHEATAPVYIGLGYLF